MLQDSNLLITVKDARKYLPYMGSLLMEDQGL